MKKKENKKIKNDELLRVSEQSKDKSQNSKVCEANTCDDKSKTAVVKAKRNVLKGKTCVSSQKLKQTNIDNKFNKINRTERSRNQRLQ